MKVNLIAIGKLKDDFYRAAFAEYEKRLSRFCIFSLVELPEAKLSDKLNDITVAAALEKEAVLIKKALIKDALTVSFTIEGKKLTSEGFSKFINCGRNVNLIIGSTHGLSPEIKAISSEISFSDMTFPHGLFRVMVAEQLYRAFMIESGAAYHSNF
jgi:23S rRNA (pseudouridine1915-N3)-methyltransferase